MKHREALSVICSRGIRSRWTQSEIYRLTVAGLPRDHHRASAVERERMREAEPEATGTRWDELVAAMVEHLSLMDGATPPAWTQEPWRFANGCNHGAAQDQGDGDLGMTDAQKTGPRFRNAGCSHATRRTTCCAGWTSSCRNCRAERSCTRSAGQRWRSSTTGANGGPRTSLHHQALPRVDSVKAARAIYAAAYQGKPLPASATRVVAETTGDQSEGLGQRTPA